MRIGISTASLFARDYAENTLDIIKNDVGTSFAEVFLNTFSEYTPEFFDMLKGRLDSLNMTVHSLHPQGTQFEPALFSIYERARSDAKATFLRILSGMRKIGANIYVFHGPSTMGGIAKNLSFNRVGPIMHELCDMAANFGVNIALENVSWCLFKEPDFAERILNAANTDNLRFTLDIKQAMRSGHSPFEYLKVMNERLINVHICDYKIIDKKISLCMPGMGEFDFSMLFSTLDSIQYSGNLFIEVYSDMYDNISELKRSYDSMNNLLYRL
ncbi:MAG: sugar phosphate isomerase/epimerase [Clostridia bacterium]